MRRIAISAAVILGAVVAVAAMLGAFASGSAKGSGDPNYTIELNNAFGLISGEQFKIAGVPAGSISSISLDPRTLNARVKVNVASGNYGEFHTDATCLSRPQSLIGEYFIDCSPGTPSAPVLPNGGTIPASHTFSTIPADLIQDVMRMPYRERLTLIINELGAAVAGNPANLQSALRRAVPALTQTDNLLQLLANDSHTIQSLTSSANSVITALADNGHNVRRFVVGANKTVVATATQDSNLKATFQNLPGFLQQLKPDLANLGAAADANVPVLTNLNDSSAQIDRLFKDVVPFSKGALPAVKTLGQASVTGHQAVVAAGPTVQHLSQFAQPTPELAQNLAIVLHDLNTQDKAVEPNPLSPGGKGYTGLQAVLQYGFQQTNAIDYFGQFGHMLAVDGFISECSPYEDQATIKASLALYGPSFRRCYQFLGPNQPGINERDPTNPTGAIPDPGGSPPGEPGPTGSITTPLASARTPRATTRTKTSKHVTGRAQQTAPTSSAPPGAANQGGNQNQAPGSGSGTGGTGGSGTGTGGTSGSGGAGGSGNPPTPTSPSINLGGLGQLLNGLLGTGGSSGNSSGTGGGLGGLLNGLLGGGGTTSSNARSAPAAPTPQQAQQLLNYLLAP